ncbi:PhnD/SsuA/transferrin family substrate-binding protein [Coraliomargarita sp. W4R72]
METEQNAFYGYGASLYALRWLCLCLCGFSLLGLGSVKAQESPDWENYKVRVIISMANYADVNVNDATAAFRFWMSEFGQEMNLPVARDAMLLTSVEAIVHELDQSPNHLVSISVPEYISIGPERFTRKIYMIKGEHDETIGNRYLLLVRANSSIQTLSDLSDKKLVHYDFRETVMAQEWLDYQLADAGLASSAELLASYKKDTNLSTAVLSVFFGKADACLVSDGSFDLLCELNPQLRVKLQVLAQSPVVMNSAVFTQVGFDPDLENRASKAIEAVGADTQGEQMLTMFRTDSVSGSDLSELQGTLDLYQKWLSVREEDE